MKPAGGGQELVGQIVSLEEGDEALELLWVFGTDVGSLALCTGGLCTGGLSPCALFCSFAWWVERFLVHLQRLKYVILWQDKQGKPVVLAYIM